MQYSVNSMTRWNRIWMKLGDLSPIIETLKMYKHFHFQSYFFPFRIKISSPEEFKCMLRANSALYS